MDRETIRTEVLELLALHEAAKEALHSGLGVHSVGIGFGGDATTIIEVVGFRAYIYKYKVTNGDVDLSRIPTTIEGKTVHHILEETPDGGYDSVKDYEKVLDALIPFKNKKKRPLLAGTRIWNSKIPDQAGGTLGCFGRIADPSSDYDGKRVLVSNRHVMAGLTNPLLSIVGQGIGQPNITDWPCGCDDVGLAGTLLSYSDFEADIPTADVAIALIPDALEIENRTKGMDDAERIKGAAPLVEGSTLLRVLPGDAVWKDGARTDRSSGTVVDIMYQSVDADKENIALKGYGDWFQCMVIHPGSDCEYNLFGFQGDSGSAVLNSDNEVVGLYFLRGPFWHGVACHIGNAMEQLKFEVLSGDGSDGDGTVVPTRGRPLQSRGGKAGKARPRTPYARTRRALLDHGSTAFADLLETHDLEVMKLVLESRSCKLAWHRNHGPAFLLAFMRGLEAPNKPLPTSIQGVTLSSLVIAMAASLSAHGSEALASAIERFLPQILEALPGVTTMSELYQLIGEEGKS